MLASICMSLPTGALPADESSGCEGADKDGDCPEQAAAFSCRSDNTSGQHDVVSSDYRFVYLGCKVHHYP